MQTYLIPYTNIEKCSFSTQLLSLLNEQGSIFLSQHNQTVIKCVGLTTAFLENGTFLGCNFLEDTSGKTQHIL